LNSKGRCIKRHTGLLALTAVLVACGGGGGDSDNETTSDMGQDARVAQMRFVNIVPDAPQIEFFHSGTQSSPFTNVLGFGESSARNNFVTGTFQFNFSYINGQGQRISLFEASDFQLSDGDEFSFIMIGDLLNAELLMVENEEFLLGLDDATADVEPQLQFVHTAVGVGAIDFYLTENGADLASATAQATLSFGESSSMFDIAASDTAQLRVFSAGSTADLLFDSGATTFARTTRSMVVAANYFGPSNNSTQDNVQLLRFGEVPVALANANQPSSIRIHNAISDENAVDLFLDGTLGTAPLIAGVEFTERSAEIVVPAGTNDLLVTAANNAGNVLLTLPSAALIGGERRTLYVGGEASDPDDGNNINVESMLVTESNRAIAAGVPVRIFNGATQSTSLLVFLLRPGEAIETSAPNTLPLGGYTAVPAVSGDFDLVVVDGTSNATIYGPERITPQQGTTMNIVIRDTSGGTTPIVVDFVNEPTTGP